MSTQPEHAVIPDWTFGDHLRKARSVAKMDQRTFAAALGVPAGSLAAWETDRARPRDVVAFAKRVELLTRIPAAWLLGLGAEGPRPTPGGDGQWAPWGSNPQPTDYTSSHVSGATIHRFPSVAELDDVERIPA